MPDHILTVETLRIEISPAPILVEATGEIRGTSTCAAVGAVVETADAQDVVDAMVIRHSGGGRKQGIPRFWRLFSFVMSRKTRSRVFKPAARSTAIQHPSKPNAAHLPAHGETWIRRLAGRSVGTEWPGHQHQGW
jgi:hypothetical protein